MGHQKFFRVSCRGQVAAHHHEQFFVFTEAALDGNILARFG